MNLLPHFLRAVLQIIYNTGFSSYFVKLLLDILHLFAAL